MIPDHNVSTPPPGKGSARGGGQNRGHNHKLVAGAGNRPFLSKAVAAAIRRAFPRAAIHKVERETAEVAIYEVELERQEIHAVAKFVKLKKPRVVYEAEWTVGGKEIEIRVAADGKLLSKEAEDDDD